MALYPWDSKGGYPDFRDVTNSTLNYQNTTIMTSDTTTRLSSPLVSATTDPTTEPTSTIAPLAHGYRFPYPVLMIVFVWMILGAAYFVSRWRQRAKSVYLIPRVFVLCSPRTVQFHYELILRVGLASYDFNPDRNDIDLSIQGQQKNEVVPITRINTKTLLDEPLITSLSLVVYRLVEMPPLGGLVLRHSGPFRAWVYAYDFTVIDLSTNKEQYYTLNQYIGSLNRVIPLDAQSGNINTVNYPIDDVPLPTWTLEDIFLLLFTVINAIMLVVTMMPINCTYFNDIIAIILTAVGAGCLVFFLDWLLYYHLRWSQDRREYFNDPEGCRFCPSERMFRIIIGISATIVGLTCIYFAMPIDNWKNSIVWLLVVVNSSTIVMGTWNLARQVEMGETIVGLGLKLRGTEMVSVGMRYSDMVSDMRTKSGSASDDGTSSISMSSGKMGGGAGHLSVGLRSSVKSFGFDPVGGKRILTSTMHRSGISSTGATPNNWPGSQILKGPQGSARHSHSKRSHSPHHRVSFKSSINQQHPTGSTMTKVPSSALTHAISSRPLASASGLAGSSMQSRPHSETGGRSGEKERDKDKEGSDKDHQEKEKGSQRAR